VNAETAAARMSLDAETLRFEGALVRSETVRLWPQLQATTTALAAIDLSAVERIDSAGLALLSWLATRAGGALRIEGSPPGYAELRAAYRLDDGLGYASA
jgi:phospholipid transport system transporter-binding protein